MQGENQSINQTNFYSASMSQVNLGSLTPHATQYQSFWRRCMVAETSPSVNRMQILNSSVFSNRQNELAS